MVSRKNFFKNFFMSLSCEKLLVARAIFNNILKYRKQFFEKGHQRYIPVNSLENLTCDLREEDFLRISSNQFSESGSHSPEPCLLKDQNSYEIISKSDQQFQRRRFLKNCLKNSIWLPWQPEFLMKSNSVKKF